MSTAHAKDNGLGKDAQDFINSLSSQVAELNQNRSLDKITRQQKFMKLVERGFDLPWIAKFVLGRSWKTASPDQQKEYLSLFKNLVELTYSKRFIDYSQQKIIVSGHKMGKRKFIFVESQLADPKNPKANVNIVWRLLPKGNSFKIVDVVIAGISMAITQRNEYSAVVKRNNGSFESLLAAMKVQIKKLRSAP
jgi:phospholipid transport system substrate-binding protein